MKTGIITFHFVNNFGGALQAYALQQTIEKYFHSSVEILDYKSSFIQLTDAVRLFPISGNPREIVTGMKTMKDRFGRCGKFQKFRQEKMHLSPVHYHHRRLKSNPPEADVYICGSDQIWNPFLTFGVKGAYFLDFAKEGKKKIAYAPSFGKIRLFPLFRKKVRAYLNDFDAVSVREKTGINIVKGLVDKDVKQLIDPVFLLSKEEWADAAADTTCKKPYLLLYIMQSDNTVYDYVKTLKKKTGLRVVEISRYGYNPGFVDETLVDLGPAEFLGLFRDADYICTNSYHGFIFSLIFEKRFCLIPCRRFRTRIYNLADLLSINIEETKAEEADDTHYDAELVRSRIGYEKKKALKWLGKTYGTGESADGSPRRQY